MAVPLVAALALVAGAVDPLLPPELVAHIRAAEQNDYGLIIAREELAARAAQQSAALGALLPRLTATGTYTRNQYETRVTLPVAPGEPPTTITFVPRDQVNASGGLVAPVVDPGAFFRLREARRATALAERAAAATLSALQLEVARRYFNVLAAQALVTAAERAVASSEANLEVAQARLRAGAGTRLAVDTARADLARARRTRVDAERDLSLARRALASLTRREVPAQLAEMPDPVVPPISEEELTARAMERHPDLLRARAALEQARAARGTAWTTSLPSLVANAQENYTNAPGFLGRNTYWTAGGTLSWTIDPWGTRAALRQADAQIRAAQARLDQTAQRLRDDLHAARLEVEASQSRLTEARAERDSTRRTLAQVQARVREGVAAPLESSQALSELLRAEAAFIQARTSLAVSLLALRTASGELLVGDADPGSP